MKKILFIIVCILCAINLFAQNSYFVDKKGNRTNMENESVNIILIDKRISYSLPGKTWEKYVKFDDLDYAVVGPSLLKSFKLNNKKPSRVFFILGEKEDKQLIGVKITTTTTSEKGNTIYSNDFYQLIVIDKDQMIIEDLSFNLSSRGKKVGKGNEVAPMIEKYFSDCPDVMVKLEKYRASILDFFTDTTYINCKK